MTQLRDPGLNEQRCITRQQLGFYHGLVIAGIYSFPTHEFPGIANRPHLAKYFCKALEHCVNLHPILATVISDADTNKSKFHLAVNLTIKNHILIWNADTILDQIEPTKDKATDDSVRFIEKTIEFLTNKPFSDVNKVPPWRIVIVEKPDGSNNTNLEFLVAYNYSHSHGDGTSGLTFHRTLLQSLRSVAKFDALTSLPEGNGDVVFWTSSDSDCISLPPALDAPKPLPISWSFLLQTLANEFLPPLPKLPFLWAASSPSKPWTGSRIFYDKSFFKTALQIVSIEPPRLMALLQKCRSQNIKLTGLLDSLLAHSLLGVIGNPVNVPILKGAIPVNLRKAINAPQDQMGVLPSVWMQTHDSTVDPEFIIKRAQKTTHELAKASSTLQDQPVGLLRFVGNFRSWYEGKVGKPRAESYEVSNIMTLDQAVPAPGVGVQNKTVNIDEIFYAQPANVTGPAITFNVVSVKGGALNLGISWQVGALGLEIASEYTQESIDHAERELVRRLCEVFEELVNQFIDTD